VGKSTVGVILAKIIGYRFMDADLVIQEKENALLKDIIADKGVEGFISVENEVLSSIKTTKTVIATGGSAVYGKEAMKHLAETGVVIYLRLSFSEIDKRLGDIKGRGVVLRDGQTLKDIYDERAVLYEKYADIVVNEEGLSIEETVEKVRELLVFCRGNK